MRLLWFRHVIYLLYCLFVALTCFEVFLSFLYVRYAMLSCTSMFSYTRMPNSRHLEQWRSFFSVRWPTSFFDSIQRCFFTKFHACITYSIVLSHVAGKKVKLLDRTCARESGSILTKYLLHKKRGMISDRLMSVVCLCVCLSVNFSHFQLLLKNHWASFNQTWHKASLGGGDSSLFK